MPLTQDEIDVYREYISNPSKLDMIEKVDILFKNSLNFPATSEELPFDAEGNIPFNNYLIGDDIWLDYDLIPSTLPDDFDTNDDYVKPLNDLELEESDFNTDIQNYGVREYNGVIRKYTGLKLEPVLATGNRSYYKIINGVNLLKDAIQFNVGENTAVYGYQLWCPLGGEPPSRLQNDTSAGSWFYNVKNGLITFSDYDVISDKIENPPGTVSYNPILIFYQYIGRKGTNKLVDMGTELPDKSLALNKQLFINTTDNTLHRYDATVGADGEWISVGGGGGGGGSDSIINAAGQTFAQIMTEPPDKFTKDDLQPLVTTDSITLTWNYNNITPTLNYKKLTRGTLKERTLPYINNIAIEYKLPDHDGWFNLNSDTYLDSIIDDPIPDDKSYLEYTTITIKKDPTDPLTDFSVRIYGDNDNKDGPLEGKIILFDNLNFLEPGEPERNQS